MLVIVSSINDFIEIIRKEGMRNYTPSFFYAEVTRDYPNIELKFNDMILKKEQVKYTSWIKFLCEGYMTESANGPDPHRHKIKEKKLKKGDTVLIKIDGDSVLILDRVVV